MFIATWPKFDGATALAAGLWLWVSEKVEDFPGRVAFEAPDEFAPVLVLLDPVLVVLPAEDSPDGLCVSPAAPGTAPRSLWVGSGAGALVVCPHVDLSEVPRSEGPTPLGHAHGLGVALVGGWIR